MALVLGVDAAALAVYFLAGLAHAAPATRLGFTAVWTAATLVVVLVGLTRIRRARLDAPRRR